MKFLKFLILLMLIPSLAFGAASRDFDGAGDLLTYASQPYGTGSVTYEVASWINIDDKTKNPGNDFFMEGGTSAAKRRILFTIQSSNFIHSWWDASDLSASYTPNNGAWAFVTANYDGSSVRESWVDGTKIANDTNSSLNLISSSANIGGSRPGAGNGDMNGRISHHHTYTRVLNNYEREEIRWKPGTVTTNLKTYSPIWGTANPEEDLSGNSNTLTIVGTTANTSGPPVMFGGGLPT